MAMGGVLLRRAALCTRRHLRLSPPAPLLAAAAATAAVQRPFCSYVVEIKPGGEEVPNKFLDESLKPGGVEVLNPYLGESFTQCDLQQLIEQQSKGDAQVLPLITEEIVFRRLVRMCKRSIASTNNSMGMGYYMAIGSGLTNVIPTTKVENENLLHPQFRRIIHYHRFIEDQSTKEAVSEEGEDATKWKDIFREVRPSCYDLLPRCIKRTLVYVSVELGDMCERGEMKGEDAYDLLKHIVKDMEENREEDWNRKPFTGRRSCFSPKLLDHWWAFILEL